MVGHLAWPRHFHLALGPRDNARRDIRIANITDIHFLLFQRVWVA